MMGYRVELDELLAFVDKLSAFEQRAEAIATRVNSQVSGLHENWSGDAATAHRSSHDEWIAGDNQMREALSGLRETAHTAHTNYSEAVQLNIAMWHDSARSGPGNLP